MRTSTTTGAAQDQRSRSLFERALDRLPGGNTRTTLFVPPSPPYVVRGEGPYIFDADGRKLIDAQGNYTSLVHGHCARPVVDAAISAISTGASFGLPTEAEIAFAEDLDERDGAGRTWRFANSGTEAVMMAVRAARAYTGRSLVLRFTGCFHGTYDTVMPEDAAGVLPGRDSIEVPFGDEEAFVQTMAERGGQIACVLADLMPNRAGMRPATQRFAEALKREADAAGALLVVDEVITYRLAVGGLQRLYGLTSDIIVLGKLIGGGFPIGAIGGRPDVMEVFDPRREGPVTHAGTFAANPVSLGAGRAAMRLLNGEAIDRIDRLGDRLREGIRELGFEVNGRGSLLRVLAESRQPELWWALYGSGVLTAPNGLLCISTAMSDTTIDGILGAFAAVEAE